MMTQPLTFTVVNVTHERIYSGRRIESTKRKSLGIGGRGPMVYPHFIEVHIGYDRAKRLVNIDQIESVGDRLIQTSSGQLAVVESYDELETLIRESGSLIRRDKDE